MEARSVSGRTNLRIRRTGPWLRLASARPLPRLVTLAVRVLALRLLSASPSAPF
jgi:hypothetical protein